MKKIFLTLSLLTAYNSSVIAAAQQNDHALYKCAYANCTYRGNQQDLIRHMSTHDEEFILDDEDSIFDEGSIMNGEDFMLEEEEEQEENDESLDFSALLAVVEAHIHENSKQENLLNKNKVEKVSLPAKKDKPEKRKRTHITNHPVIYIDDEEEDAAPVKQSKNAQDRKSVV